MPKKQFLVLNAILVTYLIIIILSFHFSPVYEVLSYATDAKEYLSVRNEFFDLNRTGASNVRPFLYPLFLKIFYGIGGVKGVWITQLALWIASANFLYLAVKRFSGSVLLAAIGVIVFAGNLTLIAMTYHALTELVTVFLLCWLTFVFTSNDKKNPFWILKIISLTIALALVKPLFLYPAFALIATGLLFYFRSLISSPKVLFTFLLILLPLLIQYSVMKIKYDKWEFSEITGITVRNYIVAQSYQVIEGMDRDLAVQKAGNLTKEEVRERIKDHFSHFRHYFFTNVEQNVSGEPFYLMMKPGYPQLYHYQFSLNKKYWRWINTLLILSLLTAIHQFINKRFWRNLLTYVPIALFLYIVYSSGISFYQGDRLTVSALPLGIVSLLLPIAYTIKVAKEKKSQ